MQPQGHMQVVMRTVDQHLHPQAVLDAPRWRWEHGRTVWIEDRTPVAIIDGLRNRGHDVKVVRRAGGIWAGSDHLADR